MQKPKFWNSLNIDQKVGLVSIPLVTVFVFLTLILVHKPTDLRAGAFKYKQSACEICQDRCQSLHNTKWINRCLTRCQKICSKITPTPVPTRIPTPQPIRIPSPIPSITPVCGNGVCEPGEADVYDCFECPPNQICSQRPCYYKPGSCPQDCEASEQQACHTAGGTWTTFRNSCADKCISDELMGGRVVCLDVITEGCDCGPDKCWNDSYCLPNNAYPQNTSL